MALGLVGLPPTSQACSRPPPYGRSCQGCRQRRGRSRTRRSATTGRRAARGRHWARRPDGGRNNTREISARIGTDRLRIIIQFGTRAASVSTQERVDAPTLEAGECGESGERRFERKHRSAKTATRGRPSFRPDASILSSTPCLTRGNFLRVWPAFAGLLKRGIKQNAQIKSWTVGF